MKRVFLGITWVMLIIFVVIMNLNPQEPNYVEPESKQASKLYLDSQEIEERPDYYEVRKLRDNSYVYLSSKMIHKYNVNNSRIWTLGNRDNGIEFEDYLIYLSDISEGLDGSLLGIGVAIDKLNSSKIDYVIIEIDSLGNISRFNLFKSLNLYTNIKELDSLFTSEHIITTNDGGYTSITNNFEKKGSLLVHFSSQHEIQWSKVIEHEVVSFNIDLYQNHTLVTYSQDGNYYLVNQKEDEIIKISDSGSILWRKSFDIDITEVIVTNEDKLIVSGVRSIDAPIRREINKFILIVERLYWNLRMTFAVLSEINTEDGHVNWYSEYHISDLNLFGISIHEDEEGNLYHYVGSSYLNPKNEFIIKYDKSGNRLGEVILSNSYTRRVENYRSQISNLFIINDELTFFNWDNPSYAKVELDNVSWARLNIVDYRSIMDYQHFLLIRVWINRIAIIAFAFTIYIIIIKQNMRKKIKR